MMWEFTNDRPIYLQLIEQIKLRVINGTYKPGDKVPSVREIAMEAGVNPNTVQRAFLELERSGILSTQRTLGRFVTDKESDIQNNRDDMAKEQVEIFVGKMKELGLTGEDVIRLVQAYLNEEGK
ncbi:MAG: GntR family transcriptional regulator [Lachnospiraceae bacterium]|nr:GntR family transcriptional regulator [Lachnospiraceae bacterium]